MGLMRLAIPPAQQAMREVFEQAYVWGIDRAAWQVRATIEGGVLALERDVSESARVQVPWPVEGHGLMALSTATLLEQPEAYQLPLELARGTVGDLRNQLFEWQAAGLVVPEEVGRQVREAIEHLGWAAVRQEEPAEMAAQAQSAIRAALDASQTLAAAYIEQAAAVRRRNGRLASFLGADLGGAVLDDYTARQFLQTFNTAVVPIAWKEVEASEGEFSWTISDQQIEWCRRAGLKVCVGPLFQLDERSLPDWTYLWEGDFENLAAAVSQFLEAAVTRYRGKVDLWLCTGRLNSAEVLSLSEEERLQLAAHAIKLVAGLDPAAPAMITMDQPWGEYMGRREVDLPPLHFADALVRAGLDLKGLVLEMNLGYGPGNTLPRTPLEFSRQLDYWSLLGLPLLVSLSVPSAYHDDPLAQRRTKLPPGSCTLQSQQSCVTRYVPLALAKAAVQGVLWNQLCDNLPHDFPHAGLFDERRHGKPALRRLAAIRQMFLK